MIDGVVFDLALQAGLQAGLQAMNDALAEAFIRIAVFPVGVAVMLHFAFMACACDGRAVPHLDACFIAASGASGFAVAFCAVASGLMHLLIMLALMSACMIVLMLRLWLHGFYVSAFFKQRARQ